VEVAGSNRERKSKPEQAKQVKSLAAGLGINRARRLMTRRSKVQILPLPLPKPWSALVLARASFVSLSPPTRVERHFQAMIALV